MAGRADRGEYESPVKVSRGYARRETVARTKMFGFRATVVTLDAAGRVKGGIGSIGDTGSFSGEDFKLLQGVRGDSGNSVYSCESGEVRQRGFSFF